MLKMIKNLVIFSILALVLSFTVFTSCDNTIFVGSVGSNTGDQIRWSYHSFDGTQTKTIRVNAGKTLVITYSSVVEKGTLKIEVTDSVDGQTTALPTDSSGIKTVTATSDVTYKLVITGSQTQGSFNVSWKTQ
jgi:hypothetical protein